MSRSAMFLWKFADAPRSLRILAPHGPKNGNWLAEIPPHLLDDARLVLQSLASQGAVTEHPHPSRKGDWIVMIGSSKPAAPNEPRSKFREHIAASTCWCEPEPGHVDPDTGATVWIHKGLQ